MDSATVPGTRGAHTSLSDTSLGLSWRDLWGSAHGSAPPGPTAPHPSSGKRVGLHQAQDSPGANALLCTSVHSTPQLRGGSAGKVSPGPLCTSSSASEPTCDAGHTSPLPALLLDPPAGPARARLSASEASAHTAGGGAVLTSVTLPSTATSTTLASSCLRIATPPTAKTQSKPQSTRHQRKTNSQTVRYYGHHVSFNSKRTLAQP